MLIQYAEKTDEQGVESGKTALHLAAINGHLGVAKVLIDNAANPETEDHKLETPVTYARKASKNREQFIQLLDEAIQLRAKWTRAKEFPHDDEDEYTRDQLPW